MNQLSGLIISNDASLRSEMTRVLSQIEFVRLMAPALPLRAAAEVEATAAARQPAFCFVDVADLHMAADLSGRILERSPGTYLIGVGGRGETGLLVPALRAGLRGFISRPLTVAETRLALEAIPEAAALVAAADAYPLFSFLPAKPGVGASTVCVNTAAALSQRPNTRTALLDFDLHCGSLDFLLNLTSGFTVRDAMEYADRMEPGLWQQLVSKVGQMDVLRAGLPDPHRPVSASRTGQLLSFAREHYNSVCVDLAGMGDGPSYEVLRMSRLIVLVTTAEITSVYMAGRMLESLENHGLGDRVRVVLNRNDASAPLSRGNVENCLGRPVLAAIPNHYGLMQQALKRGQGVIGEGPLARAFTNLAVDLAGLPLQKEPHGILGLLDRFFASDRARA